MAGPRRTEMAATVGSAPVVVGRVLSHHDTQVAFAGDQHLVCDLRPGGEHEPLRTGVRPRAPGWDLRGLDTGAGQGRAGRIGELPGTVADQELEVRSAVTEVVGADNLCHQAIFMDRGTSAVAPPDPEMVQVGDAVG